MGLLVGQIDEGKNRYKVADAKNKHIISKRPIYAYFHSLDGHFLYHLENNHIMAQIKNNHNVALVPFYGCPHKL